jgi:hypothetical protein
MPFSLNLYHDQIAANGASASPLPAAHRLLYVRHGRAEISGQAVNADQAACRDGAFTVKSAGEWCQLWRWELALPNAAPTLLEGEGVLSSLRMSRVITTLAMGEGSRWLFRLDQIITGPGRIADRHQLRAPASVACSKARSMCSRMRSRIATSRLATRGGKPARTL